MDMFPCIDRSGGIVKGHDGSSRYEPLPHKAFPATSLRGWMALAQASGIPSVPAKFLGSVPINPLLHFKNPIKGTREALDLIVSYNEMVSSDEMLRWDCCAPWGVKAALGSGRLRPSHQETQLEADDPRAFDLLYDYPSEDVGVFSRPWVQAMIFDNYPVEFRVFIDDGLVVGVSNYYPRRSLPDHPKVRALAGRAVQMANLMLDKAQERGVRPWMPGMSEDQRARFSATVDFIVLSSARLLLLEGGPGLEFGGHPCCFIKHIHGMTGSDPVRGLRLGIGQPSIPLSELV